MPTHQIRIEGACELPELTVQLEFPGGAPPQRIDLRDGQFNGELPARPIRLCIVPPLDLSDESAEGELGCDILPAADLTFQLRLTEHELSISAGSSSGQRYGFLEHSRSADYIGYELPYRSGKQGALVDRITELPIGRCELPYGAIMALAGDHFAYLDSIAAHAEKLLDSWPQRWQQERERKTRRSLYLSTASLKGVRAIQSGSPDSLLRNEHPIDFLDLALHNFCHFAPQPGEDPYSEALGLNARRSDPWSCYHYYHDRALQWALDHRGDRTELLRALGIDAFGAHFLTDLFASGHMRVPRRYLVQTASVQLWGHVRSLRMHHHDNREGLWVTTTYPFAPRWVWRAYGDTYLYNATHDAHQGELHAMIVEESVRRSAREVLLVWQHGEVARLPHPMRTDSGMVHADSAEALIPRVLPVEFSPAAEQGIACRGLKWTGNEEPQREPLYACREDSTPNVQS